jgi:hypothetical protein
VVVVVGQHLPVLLVLREPMALAVTTAKQADLEYLVKEMPEVTVKIIRVALLLVPAGLVVD